MVYISSQHLSTIRIFDGISKVFVTLDALLAHTPQHRNKVIYIIVNKHFPFFGIRSMQATDILRQNSLPGNRHFKKQRIKTGIVKTLPYVAACCNQYPLFRFGYFLKTLQYLAALPYSHAAVKQQNVPRETAEPLGKPESMVLAFGDDDRRALLIQGLQYIIENQRIACLVLRQSCINSLNRNTLFPDFCRKLEFSRAQDHPVFERTFAGLRFCGSPESHRATLHEDNRMMTILTGHGGRKSQDIFRLRMPEEPRQTLSAPMSIHQETLP